MISDSSRRGSFCFLWSFLTGLTLLRLISYKAAARLHGDDKIN